MSRDVISFSISKVRAFELDAEAAKQLLVLPHEDSPWRYAYSIHGRDGNKKGPGYPELLTPLFESEEDEDAEVERLLLLCASSLETWFQRGSSTALTTASAPALHDLRKRTRLTRKLRDYNVLVANSHDMKQAKHLLKERLMKLGMCPVLHELASYSMGLVEEEA